VRKQLRTNPTEYAEATAPITLVEKPSAAARTGRRIPTNPFPINRIKAPNKSEEMESNVDGMMKATSKEELKI